ncbi:MAG: hypothetical protein A3C43_03665 [Candidatus Schekmanbacteria bacterium RIFCSPHIGHO2_02_FULL_38_11]|uniref:Transport permease protein n=1 Tax=Candidatus Schekmanbacteria bacterium RIFCSPLOWO2_12_FULL_38_15 TaxID=1817883 RepID=A0A1F7SQE2_9BACT|nr:MAG: hypothetical protein A2043_02855 [Candidatus Schekmanbacteria bacterium GWA2_38_9]OGL50272.1 MAG: hypothetical protein A3H37_00775 [Candidatus Schekmanbacteria bacterium RIFCSPLOWO2_02_FULL_38_14]OGL52315.1 MAG: hypothetical protein A3C43_03665 [Candidatus Schekmanbacteria bacterium RIFCSPHIGHO2_02_FULL_38_11]OGL55417.1 MAG: hypothetical protein A3G31_01225 [Candidatus Schekmanbacteria bacterium RIFCSPLOWO2_12_FULL_38_15]
MTINNPIKTVSKFHYIELVYNLAKKDLKVRYKTAALGFLWAILNPLLMMIVLTVIFSIFFRIKTDQPYSVFVLTGLIPWAFFNLSLSSCTNSIVDNSNLIKKVYFPREIIPISIVTANLINFFFSIIILFLFLLFFKIRLTYMVLFLPVTIALQVLFTIGISLLTSSLNVYYRDIRYIVEAALLMWFYATPVFYPVTMVPERLKTYYFLNPMAGIITSYRRVLLEGLPPDFYMFLETSFTTLAVCLIGYVIFKRIEPVFADLV